MTHQQKRTVVIGGAGFIGSYIVHELLESGYEVVVIDNLSAGLKSRIPDGVTIIKVDICDYPSLLPHIDEGDIIFHLAAIVSVPLSIENPLASYENNVRGTYNVFEAARIKKASGVIFSSSAAVYGNQEGKVSEDMRSMPNTPYGLHKLIGEQMAHSYHESFGLPIISLRYFNVYGKGNNESGAYAPVTARFLKQKREGLPLTVTGDGSQTRDFVHVTDVARANVMAIKLLASGNNRSLNICSSEDYSVKQIAEIIGGEINYVPARNEIQHSVGDNAQARSILGWEPAVTLEKGIAELLIE